VLGFCSADGAAWLSYGIEISAVPAGAGIVWVGTLLYNSSCFTPAVLASLTANMPAHTLAALLQWAVKVPNIIAGCFFVLGSYVAWACAVRSFSLLHIWQQRLPIGSFWAYALYLMVRSLTRHIHTSSLGMPLAPHCACWKSCWQAELSFTLHISASMRSLKCMTVYGFCL